MSLGDRKPNKWWTESDTFAMLGLIEHLGLVHELDKKRQRNESHFRRLRQGLAKRDVHFTVSQIRNRWKSLKHKYRKIKLTGYRSNAARLSAVDSFRYFRKLDVMLSPGTACGGGQEGAPASCGGGLEMRSPSDPEDHTDSDVAPMCPPTAWPDTITPKLEVKVSPGGTASISEPSHWSSGTDEIITLGVSGEYLCPVKAEPQTAPSPQESLEGAREFHPCGIEGFPAGTSVDTPTLILQQLTVLNHRLAEQLAEQRAFHCSMLGMMDRQIEVLEQLSAVARVSRPEPNPPDIDPSLTQRVREALVQILNGMDQSEGQSQGYQPCLAKQCPPQASPLVSRTVSPLQGHQGSPSITVEQNGDAGSTQNDKSKASHHTPPPSVQIQLPSPPVGGDLVNGHSGVLDGT